MTNEQMTSIAALKVALAEATNCGAIALLPSDGERHDVMRITSSLDAVDTTNVGDASLLAAEISGKIAMLRSIAIDPMDIKYTDVVSFEVRPADEGDRVNVYRKGWGCTVVNYTNEGLILDVYDEEQLSPVHTASIERPDLVGDTIEVSEFQKPALAA